MIRPPVFPVSRTLPNLSDFFITAINWWILFLWLIYYNFPSQEPRLPQKIVLNTPPGPWVWDSYICDDGDLLLTVAAEASRVGKKLMTMGTRQTDEAGLSRYPGVKSCYCARWSPVP